MQFVHSFILYYLLAGLDSFGDCVTKLRNWIGWNASSSSLEEIRILIACCQRDVVFFLLYNDEVFARFPIICTEVNTTFGRIFMKSSRRQT